MAPLARILALGLPFGLALLFGARAAQAQGSAGPRPAAPAAGPPTDHGGPLDSVLFTQEVETAPPPPSSVVFFQYGVAFAAEQVTAAGPICDNPGAPCILGGGGGIVIRGGWRSTGPLYLGLAYELTKQDPNKLYRIALLQQARAEARYYFFPARVTEPYALVDLGFAGYGNEFRIDPWGPTAALGAGLEYQISQNTVVGVAFAYRFVYLSRFTDTAGTPRDSGIAQLLGLNLVLEQRDAIVSVKSDGRSP